MRGQRFRGDRGAAAAIVADRAGRPGPRLERRWLGYSILHVASPNEERPERSDTAFKLS